VGLQESFLSTTSQGSWCQVNLDFETERLYSRASFVTLSRWLADARALASAHLVVVLVGNKSDRDEDREVPWDEASRWASEHGNFAH
jgi:GTPase SAR1 family protein